MLSNPERLEALILALDTDHSVETVGEANLLALELGEEGDPAGAQRLLEIGLNTMETYYPGFTYYISVLLYNLALQHYAQNRYGEAKDLAQRALKIREKLFGQDDAGIGTCLVLLARSWRRELCEGAWHPDLIEPRRVLERALAIHEKLGSGETADAAECMREIAKTYSNYHPEEEVIAKVDWSKRALSIVEKVASPNSPELADALVFMSWSSLYQSTDASLQVLFRAIDILETKGDALREKKDDLRNLYQELLFVTHEGAKALDERLTQIDPSLLAGIRQA